MVYSWIFEKNAETDNLLAVDDVQLLLRTI